MVCIPYLLRRTFGIHWALVFRWPLGKTAWKKVDYVWLSLALLGIFGLASETRQIFARSMKAWADTRLEASIARLQMRLDNYTEGSALCRKFNRTELSPPPGELEKIQNEYDAMCEWHRTIKPIFQNLLPRYAMRLIRSDCNQFLKLLTLSSQLHKRR